MSDLDGESHITSFNEDEAIITIIISCSGGGEWMVDTAVPGALIDDVLWTLCKDKNTLISFLLGFFLLSQSED